MTRSQLYIVIQQYVAAVDRALVKSNAPEQPRLKATGRDILTALQNWRGNTTAAHHARRAKAAEQRKAEPFTFHWRGSGKAERVVGWDHAAKRLGMGAASLRSLLSKERNELTRTLMDPATGELDSVTISRDNYSPGVGRPKRAHAPE